MIGRGHHPGMQASALNPIDTRQFGFLSYAPSVGDRLGIEEMRVSVEPDASDPIAEVAQFSRPSFPLRRGKVQRPLLPPNTLRRDRLFSWLEARASRRVVYVVAEAGFGKTTLVADFLRRSRVRTFWYRLDEDDTDGLVFLRYLVAACQAVDPRLLRRSATLLSERAVEPTREETVLRTLLDEMDCLGEVPSALVLDDFHMAEDVPAIGAIVERLIARSPAQLTLILASRRTPDLSSAALRARGELAELGRDELRFDESETDRLFRESYHAPLEPDVLHDLQARTEGWAASLQLVKTAVDGRSTAQVRAFVQSLSGAEGDLYDYLAEEVVGELRADLRGFLMRVALLEEIDPETAAGAADVSSSEARRLIGQAQRLGLLSRGAGTVASWRLHPLVGEFLLARLEAEVGQAGITDLHRGLAAALEPQSWRLAARHWAAAGDADQVRRVVCSAVPTIIGTGDFAAAADLIKRFPDAGANPWYDVLRARSQSAIGRYDEALELTLQAARYDLAGASGDPSLKLANALNLLHCGVEMQDAELRTTAVHQLVGSDDPELAAIARATQAIADAAECGSLDEARRLILETVRLSEERGHRRHEAVAWMNLADVEKARGDAAASVECGLAALRCAASIDDSESRAAHMNTAKGLAHLGSWDLAQLHMDAAVGSTEGWTDPLVIAECAELNAMYGDPNRSSQVLARAFDEDDHRRGDSVCRHVAARLMLMNGNMARARELLEAATGLAFEAGFRSSWHALDVAIRASESARDPSLIPALEEAARFAEHQQAWFWSKTIRLTQALVSGNEALTTHLRSLEPTDAAYLSIQAELVARRLADLDQTGLALIRQEATQRPERWRWALRQLLSNQTVRPGDLRRAAELLDLVGDANDIKLLRELAKKKSLRIPDAGLGLARRLAPPAFIDDLGRVTVHVGDRVLPGTEIRKKVLSLLTFLLTRPQFTASREQVIDALWPHMEPEAGANSLNQTSYFLRQVFEPAAAEDATAGYLNSRADLIWLDQELVRSRSSDCLKLIGTIRRDPSPELVTMLAESYTGRFAVDFMYDDWASAFRDTLHASFLDRIERSVVADTKAGAFDRALSVAQLALQADPDAEQIELCLLRLYRRTGAHAAAAEQYLHYASVMREQLGIEPPPLESI
jgi:LuxR family maltose regulon positive regulatory protein